MSVEPVGHESSLSSLFEMACVVFDLYSSLAGFLKKIVFLHTTCVCVLVCVCMYVYVYIYTYTYACVNIHVSEHIVCMYTCIFTHRMYVYIYIYVYMYIVYMYV